MLKESLSAIINKAAQIDDTKERVEFLRRHESAPLKVVLRCGLHPKINWLLEPGTPKYKPNREYPDLQGMLYSRTRLLYMFIDGTGNHIPPQKREKLFVEMLESILPEDAELLIQVKDKQLPKTINKNIFNKAFPAEKI